jgi:hypothetical protein
MYEALKIFSRLAYKGRRIPGPLKKVSSGVALQLMIIYGGRKTMAFDYITFIPRNRTLFICESVLDVLLLL